MIRQSITRGQLLTLISYSVAIALVTGLLVFAVMFREWPLQVVRLACDRCGRQGQYRMDTLVAKFTLVEPMPDLQHLIARWPRHGQLDQACGVYCKDLKTTSVDL